MEWGLSLSPVASALEEMTHSIQNQTPGFIISLHSYINIYIYIYSFFNSWSRHPKGMAALAKGVMNMTYAFFWVWAMRTDSDELLVVIDQFGYEHLESQLS